MHALPEGEVHTRQPPPPLQEVRLCGLRAVLRQEVPPAQPVVQTGSGLRVLLRAADVGKPGAAVRLHRPGVKIQQPVGRRGRRRQQRLRDTSSSTRPVPSSCRGGNTLPLSAFSSDH